MSRESSQRADNRRMTGNVNIYICSEGASKDKRKKIDGTSSSMSDASIDKSPQQHQPYRGSNAHRQEKLISARQFNDSHQDFKLSGDVNRRADTSNGVPRLDESDQWLRRFAKRKQDEAENFNADEKVMDEDRRRKSAVLQEMKQVQRKKVEDEKKECTCDRTKDSLDKACDPLCTCCCVQGGSRKSGAKKSTRVDAAVGESGAKADDKEKVETGEVDESKSKKKKKKEEKSSAKKEKKKAEKWAKKEKKQKAADKSEGKDERSFFARLFGISRGEKGGKCSPDCTELKRKDAKKISGCSPDCPGLKSKDKAKDRLTAGGGEKVKKKSSRPDKREFNDRGGDAQAKDRLTGGGGDKVKRKSSRPDKRELNDRGGDAQATKRDKNHKSDEKRKKKKSSKEKKRRSEDRCTCDNNCCTCPLDKQRGNNPSRLCLKCLYPSRSCACIDPSKSQVKSKGHGDKKANHRHGVDELPYQRSKVFPSVVREFKRRIERDDKCCCSEDR